jgi:hypothetical protein
VGVSARTTTRSQQGKYRASMGIGTEPTQKISLLVQNGLVLVHFLKIKSYKTTFFTN